MRATWSGAPMVAIPPALAGWDAPRTQPHRQRHPQHWTPPHPACPQCSPHRLQQPIFTSSHQSRLRFEQQPDDSPPTQRPNMGGFATIGPRHAGDTPPEASYGSNSPRTCGLGRTSNTTTSAETPSTLDTSAPHSPKAQSTSTKTAHFHQFPPKWTTV